MRKLGNVPLQKMDAEGQAQERGHSGCTAVVNLIGRFPQDTAPILCLPFDAIGARHPAIVASSGSCADCN